MIDLTGTRYSFLEQIEARHSTAVPSTDITQLGSGATGHVCLTDRTHGDLFPLLKLALSEWFGRVPRPQLNRDVLMPLKCALGNARKHGNGNDPSKSISAELVLTPKGVFLAVTDEGAGFDVAGTVRRFQEQRSYFVHGGAGLRSLHESKATVSYENGGRTLLLCFRPSRSQATSSSAEGADHAISAAGASGATVASESSRSGHALPDILDAGWMETCLAAEVPEFRDGSVWIEAGRVYAEGRRASDRCAPRYLLRLSHPGEGRRAYRILTGHFHATEAAAAADYAAAAELRRAEISKSVLIPRPVARLAAEPRLVLYEFDRWMSFWDYLAIRRSRRALRHCTEGVARALARLHGSELAFPSVPPASGQDTFWALARRTEAGPGSDVQWIQEQAAQQRPPAPRPILGAFGWDRIYYGVDGSFYLYGFETCRLGDPGLDLGGFAADLLCFTLSNHDEGLFDNCFHAFLANYNAKAAEPVDETKLRFYTTLALFDRLGRGGTRWPDSTPRLLVAASLLRPREQRLTA